MAPTPTSLDKVNFIRFWLSNPCEFPLAVYFETAWPALGKVVIALLTFGMADVVRSFFRPKGLGGHKRRGRKGDRGKKRRNAIPELADTVASHIPGAKEMKGRSYNANTKELWLLDNAGQRALYYLMIVDVVLDFWYEWQSAIIRDDRSKCAGLGRALRTGLNDLHAVFGWLPANIPHEDYAEGGVTTSNFTAVLPPGQFLVTFASNACVGDGPAINADCQLRIQVIKNEGSYFEYSEVERISNLTCRDLIARAYVIGPAIVGWQVFKSGSTVDFTKEAAFIMQVGPPGGL